MPLSLPFAGALVGAGALPSAGATPGQTGLSLTWDTQNSRGDLGLTATGLVTGQMLAAAAFISLFTDRRAGVDDTIPDGTGNPRGWWGDSFDTKPIGSRLWLLARRKKTDETLQDARDYIVEALQWLLDDAVASAVDAKTYWRGTMLCAVITITRGNGTAVALDFQWAWQGV